MAGAELLGPAPEHAPAPVRPARESTASWPLIDRVAHALCWATGIGLCLVAAAIVLYMLVKGVAYLHLSMFVQSPQPSLLQSQSGGFKDPILGTLLITAIGIAVAAPMSIALAVWLSEYARPAWLARAVESAVEMLAGVPSVVLALFGLLIFSQGFLGFLSQHAENGSVTGSSFLTAGVVMSILAMPLIVASTQEALAQLPDRLREASYALGKTRARTIRRVLLPSIRPGVATGIVLGMGRIIGDTAIITIVLGGEANRIEPAGGAPGLGLLRGVGSTLTSYVYYQSPAGEGNSNEKAYAAAFVLLAMVLMLNAVATRLTLEPARGRDGRRRAPLGLRLLELPWSR
jgi:phosphate transport system permease protein